MIGSEQKKMTARELLEEMKKYKSADSKTVLANNKTVSASDMFFPIIMDYSREYEYYELRQIMGTNMPSRLDFTELHERLRHMRSLFAQPVIDVADFACITLSIDKFNFAYLYISVSDDPRIDYISIGDSMKSYDGEWRGMIMNMITYTHIIKNYPAFVDALVAAAKYTMSYKIRMFYNTKIISRVITAIERVVTESHIGENLLALTWFVGWYTKLRSKQMSQEFGEFCKLGGTIKLENFSSIEMDDVYRIVGSFFDARASQAKHSVFERSVRVGQKLVQLTPDEVSHPLNSEYQSWNEIAVTRDTTDLLLNMISPGFAIHSFWLILFETSKFMYNIDETRTKIEKSQTARLTPADKQTTKILSTQAVCMINEYCGPTWGYSLMNKTLSAKTLIVGKKYVFEYIYSLLCMHSRLGQFHGDFHCDNATIMQLTEQNEGKWIGYIACGDKFVFRHDGSYGCVIDFSRTVHMDNPLWIERIIEKYELYFGKELSTIGPQWSSILYEAFDESKTLELLKHKVSGFDIYEFALTSLMRCGSGINGTEIAVLMQLLKDEVSKILLNVVGPRDKVDHSVDWAAHILLKKCWENENVNEFSQDKEFIGIYAHDNPMTYSISSYSSLPRTISRGTVFRDPEDEPVDLYQNGACAIKLRYDLWDKNMSGLMGPIKGQIVKKR